MRKLTRRDFLCLATMATAGAIAAAYVPATPRVVGEIMEKVVTTVPIKGPPVITTPSLGDGDDIDECYTRHHLEPLTGMVCRYSFDSGGWWVSQINEDERTLHLERIPDWKEWLATDRGKQTVRDGLVCAPGGQQWAPLKGWSILYPWDRGNFDGLGEG